MPDFLKVLKHCSLIGITQTSLFFLNCEAVHIRSFLLFKHFYNG